MPTQAHSKFVVERICPNCKTRNSRRVHLCRNCHAQLAPFQSERRPRRTAHKIARPFIRNFSNGRNFAHPLAETLKPRLEQVKNSSEEMIAEEWRSLVERWRSVVESIREMTPDLPQAAEWLSQLETNLIEITGVQLDGTSRSAAGLPLTEEFHWLRERLSQAMNEVEQMRKFRRDRDVAQMIDAGIAALRFVIAAVAILSIAFDIADRLNPRKMLRRTIRGEGL